MMATGKTGPSEARETAIQLHEPIEVGGTNGELSDIRQINHGEIPGADRWEAILQIDLRFVQFLEVEVSGANDQ